MLQLHTGSIGSWAEFLSRLRPRSIETYALQAAN